MMLLAVVCSAASSTALAQSYMDFGGMYGYSGEFEANGVYVNPYTGADSCPTGYTAYQIYGTPGPADHQVYFCGRITSVANNTTPVADFGGMWSFTYGNPLTGGYSCPTGYTQTQVLGTINVDYGLYYCHRATAASPQYRLGGMFGTYATSLANLSYPNPLVRKPDCPAGYIKQNTMGVIVDRPLYYCYQQLY